MTNDNIWNIAEFHEWLIKKTNPAYKVEDGKNRVSFKTDKYTAAIVFHDMNIIEEMIVENESDTNKFYLHFQLNTADHARELANEMLDTLIRLSDAKSTKVLLTCSSALTTSFFAEKLNESAKLLNYDMSFNAVDFGRLYEEAPNYDIVLLAPQVAFQRKKAAEVLHDQIVEAIPASAFGTYDTGTVIKLVNELMQKKRAAQAKEKKDKFIPRSLDQFHDYENNFRILTICMISRYGANRIAYRIYDHGQPTLDKEVIKPTLELSDIDDLMTYIKARHHNIDVVGISLPGITNSGRVNDPEHGFYNVDLARHIKSHYGYPTVVLNDANAMALGYTYMTDTDENIAFYFHPNGMPIPGVGFVHERKLYYGYKHFAGEVGSLLVKLVPNFEEKVMSPEGTMEIITTLLLAVITVHAPEKIIIYSEKTPNMEEIHDELAKYIDSTYIPAFEYTRSVKYYMMPGIFIRCLEIISDPERWEYMQNM